MKIKSIFIGLGFLFIFGGIAFSQSVNDIELTTYYPAPYGDYDMLSLTPSNGPPTATASEGMMYFDDGTTKAKGLYIYDDTSSSWVNISSGGGVPTGAIIMWSGTAVDIPAEWQLCDGTNGSPDLRERFIVGAGGDSNLVVGGEYAVGSGPNLDPSTTPDENTVTLTTQQMPRHRHYADSGSDGNHSNHTQGTFNDGDVRDSGHQSRSNDAYGIQTKGSHRHEFNTNYSGGLSGATQPHENRPPYYALCFIMKT